jgi:hypothetical protein
MSKRSIGAFLSLLLALCLSAAPAQANRALITEEVLKTKEDPKDPLPPPEGQIEGACGVAIGPGGDIYVSDYYHHQVDVFSPAGAYKSQFAVNSLDGVCQLAFDSAANLYANEWHESVIRLKPTLGVFDAGESTGVAVDEKDNVYVNGRDHVNVYSPAGTKTGEIGSPASLKDAYGLAVFGGRVYVPDAAAKAIEVYEPATDPLNPAFTITGSETPQHGFSSLVDATVAVDPTNGHLLVLDNLQPGFEHPKAAIDEFNATGLFLGQLKKTVIDGEPSGLTLDASGKLYVTSGNSEGARVFAFGAYTESGPEGVEGGVEEPASAAGGSVEAGATAVSAAVAGASASGATARAKDNRAQRRRAHRRARLRRVKPHRIAGHGAPVGASGGARARAKVGG